LAIEDTYNGAASAMTFMNAYIETMCRNGPARLMDTITKELNPNLSYELRKFRSGKDDFCEEAIIHG
jgi:hypothetical protein